MDANDWDDEEDEEQPEEVDVENAVWVEVTFEQLKDGNDGGFHDRTVEHPKSCIDAVHKIFVDSRSETQYPRLVIEVSHSRHEQYYGPSFEVHTSAKFSERDWWSDQLYYPMVLLPEVNKMLQQFAENIKNA